MIIDPDAQMREFLSLALSRHYQDIHTEENAEKAKQTLDNGERIDLIISDAAVGIDLCGGIKERGALLSYSSHSPFKQRQSQPESQRHRERS